MEANMQNELKEDWVKVVMVPPGTGMSIFMAQCVMRCGHNRNAAPAVRSEAEPYYRRFDKRR